MSHALRIHALRGNGQQLFAGQAYCNDLRAVEFTMAPWHEGRAPTCHRCLYALGLYVPLAKLREHQIELVSRATVDECHAVLLDAMGRAHAGIYARP